MCILLFQIWALLAICGFASKPTVSDECKVPGACTSDGEKRLLHLKQNVRSLDSLDEDGTSDLSDDSEENEVRSLDSLDEDGTSDLSEDSQGNQTQNWDVNIQDGFQCFRNVASGNHMDAVKDCTEIAGRAVGILAQLTEDRKFCWKTRVKRDWVRPDCRPGEQRSLNKCLYMKPWKDRKKPCPAGYRQRAVKRKCEGDPAQCPASHPDKRVVGGLGHRCYTAPPPGFDCPTNMKWCRGQCPDGFVPCAFGVFSCGSSKQACRMTIADMSIKVIAAAAKTTALVISAGSSGAADVGTQTALKAGGQAAFTTFKTKVLTISKTFFTKTLVNAVKKKISKIPEKALYKVCDQVAVAILDNAKKDETWEEAEKKTDWTKWDVTGFSAAIEATKGDASARDQAKAWIKAFGTFDPTGWAAAASAFIHPKCDPKEVGDLLDDDE